LLEVVKNGLKEELQYAEKKPQDAISKAMSEGRGRKFIFSTNLWRFTYNLQKHCSCPWSIGRRLSM